MAAQKTYTTGGTGCILVQVCKDIETQSVNNILCAAVI